MLSTQDLQKLLKKQKILDDLIYKTNHTTESATIDDRFVALFVEIAECLNEHKHFKYWSSARNIQNQQKIWEEYVDCLHFILSLILTLNIKTSDFVFKKQKASLLTPLILKIINYLNAWQKSRNEKNFFKFFKNFLSFGEMLNFNWQDVLKMYEHKYKINKQRQLNDG